MEKIILPNDVESLVNFGRSAMEKEEWMVAVHNFNDAFSRCASDKEYVMVYGAYAELFLRAGNGPMARYSLHMVKKTGYKGGYSYVDFARFLPENNIVVSTDEEEYPLYASDVLAFNEAYTLIASRRYADAVAKMLTLPLNRKNMTSIVDVMNLAVDNDPDFSPDAYFVGLLPLIGTYAGGDAEFINLLLSGGKNLREIAIQSAKYFVEENDDIEVLRDIGEVYFMAREFESSACFFEKLLELCEINEDALYYMMMISSFLGKEEEVKQYRGKYYEVCKFAYPPMHLIDEIRLSGASPAYLSLPEDKEIDLYGELITLSYDEDIDEEQFKKLREYICLGNLGFCSQVLTKLSEKIKTKPNTSALLLTLSESAFVRKDIKQQIVKLLIMNGYEGKIGYSTPEKSIVFECSQLHRRLGYTWNEAYKELLVSFVYADMFLPMQCSILSDVVKHCAEVFSVLPPVEDLPFAKLVVACTYVKRLKFNINVGDMIASLGVHPDCLEKGMTKYNIITPFI